MAKFINKFSVMRRKRIIFVTISGFGVPLYVLANPAAEPAMVGFFTFVILVPFSLAAEGILLALYLRFIAKVQVKWFKCLFGWMFYTTVSWLILYPLLITESVKTIIVGECLAVVVETILLFRILRGSTGFTKEKMDNFSKINAFGLALLLNVVSFATCFFPANSAARSAKESVIEKFGEEIFEYGNEGNS